jgi:hypothetical protein
MKILLLRCRYDRHMLQAFETEDRLPFPCSTHVRHLHHVSNKSRRLNQYRDEHRDSPRNHTTSPADVLPIPANGWRSLAMTSIPVSPSQRPAVQIGIPHTGALICASDMPAASPQKCTRHTGKDLPPLQTRLTRAKAHGMHRRSMIWHAAVFLYTKTDRDCASLGIIVEAGA